MTRLPPEQLVKERRLALGISQEAAAQRAGISRNEWNQMENGVRGIGPKNAARFVEVLGGDTDAYLTRASQPEIVELRRRLAELERRVSQLEGRNVP